MMGLGVSAEDIAGFAHLSLDELVRKFGTALAFRDWLIARKTIADIHEKELKNERTMGALIERELVKVHLLGLIDAAFRRLLADAPKTIARRLYAQAKSGEPVEDAEKLVRETISSILQPAKTSAARVLRNA